VHARSLGCPILGDVVYGKPDARFPQATMMLHAYSLAIRLPGHEGPSRFCAPLPGRFRGLFAGLSAG
jgi:23S rRNA pseudouridine1911/1915/1917 synthase